MDAERPHLKSLRLADRYVLEEQLASGGMGSLWIARDDLLGRPVAVKVLHEHLARDRALLERFRLEAVSAARLSHPAVVRVFDTGVDEGACYIVMELVDGSTLRELLSDGALPPGEAARILRGVLQALAHAHREGVIHGDVKPGNILVGHDGMVKLADFGIAKAAFAQHDATTTGDLLGTSRYLSPEQVAGEEVDHRSDLYSSGVVLYELLTGRPPFVADSHIATATMRLTKDPAPPGSIRPGISRQLESVVMRSLAREPDQRFQTAEEMSSALDHATPAATRVREEPTERHQLVAPQPRRSMLGSWMAIPIILAVIAALIVGGFFLLEGIAPDEPGQGEESTLVAAPLEINAVRSYDPEGSGVLGEHDDNLGQAIDGDPATYWSTEGYDQDFPLVKAGVGLVLDLGAEVQVGHVRIQTDLPGWDFNVYAGESPDSFSLAEPLIASEQTALESEIYDLEPIETRYVLIWMTGLVQSDRYRAQINEIELLSPGA
ncbi:MAG: protein kinase domain-containing protein [Actinomycetota bacterium]